MNEKLPRYDFGSRQDEVDSHGDVVPAELEEEPMSSEERHEALAELDAETLRNSAPVVIDLGERAVALAKIMEFYNKASMTRGSAALLEGDGGEFRKRYGKKTSEVQRGAERKTHELQAGFREGIDVLAAIDQLRANGYDEADIDLLRTTMQYELNKTFATGKTDAKTRNRVVNRARKSAGAK